MSLLERFGVIDNDTEQFAGVVVGRTLIMDGDSACYNVTQNCVKLKTAQDRFVKKIYEAMFLTQSQYARVHLTPKGCFKNGRHLLLGAKPYQANRGGKPKPAQLEPLRASAPSLFSPQADVQIFGHMDKEADDAYMIDAYAISNSIGWSEDKDLNIAPIPRYCINTGRILTLPKGDRFGWIGERYTDSGKPKSDGHGTKFFWLQMLMGDTADNVKGIKKYNNKLCGEVTAIGLLKSIQCEHACANLVLDGYRAIQQNPLPEAEALWLLRSHDDSGAGYIWSLNLSDANRAFIVECFNSKYKMEPHEYYEEDQ